MDNIKKINLQTNQKSKLLKFMKKSQFKLNEDKNKIIKALISKDDTSSKQAQYLNGINKKYASKAIIMNNNFNISHKDILKDLKKMRDELIIALEKDKKNHTNNNIDVSILSMNNCYEQLEEWLDIINNLNESKFKNTYSLLTQFGFPAHSIEFEHNNAVQIDPFQTQCLNIEPYTIDTCSLMHANEKGFNLKLFSNEITDGLILFNPATPITSELLMRSKIYEYICSITLCRNLNMYNPNMTYSIHAHSLLQTVNKFFNTNSSCYINLAIKILYSMRKYWGNDLCKESDNVNLFKHWFEDQKTITHADNCNHPVQLLLMLGSFDFKELGINIEEIDFKTPLLNMFNEVLARIIKIKLKNKLKNKLKKLNEKNGLAKCNNDTMETDDPVIKLFFNIKEEDDWLKPIPKQKKKKISKKNINTKTIAINLAKLIFNIKKENCPEPKSGIMEKEPPIETVRSTCSVNHNFAEHLNVYYDYELFDNNIFTFIDNKLLPYMRTFHFGYMIQKFLTSNNLSWNDLILNIEKKGDIPSDLIKYMTINLESIKSIKIIDYLQLKNGDTDNIMKCMFLQALLHHTSKSRKLINEKNVCELNTLHEYIKDLRMSVYLENCAFKNKITNNINLLNAQKADLETFKIMVGKHIHSHNKRNFKTLITAAQNNKEKTEYLLNKSANSVKKYFNENV
uniref:Uncharacterized protein n=1 Tax=viral metagenome TaxID=1070528 RepID=A0A6C0ADT2_9ZZZZ